MTIRRTNGQALLRRARARVINEVLNACRPHSDLNAAVLTLLLFSKLLFYCGGRIANPIHRALQLSFDTPRCLVQYRTSWSSPIAILLRSGWPTLARSSGIGNSPISWLRGVHFPAAARSMFFPLLRHDRICFADSATLIVGLIQSLISDSRPKLLQIRSICFVRVLFSVLRCPWHFKLQLCD